MWNDVFMTYLNSPNYTLYNKKADTQWMSALFILPKGVCRKITQQQLLTKQQ